MSASSTVSAILGIVAFEPAHIKEAEACLSEFERLSMNEKEAARGSVIEKVFPLAFGEDAAIESTPKYEELKTVPWSTNCFLSPKTIVTPTTAEQVSKILALCRFLGAIFSVRGGGRLHNPGFTSNDGGVVISLEKFDQIALSDDKSTCDVGPGLRWIDVYKSLDSHGLTVTGGRVPHVGVPGLLLGGGLSFQNSEHGFGSAGVLDYEVVLADSRIVHANANENSDLFWALKGGGTNFGVVTKFKMTTVSNKVWCEARLYPPTENHHLLEALMTYHEVIEKDSKATLIWHSVNEATLLIFFYCAPVENPDAFKCFYDVPFIMRVMEPGCRTVYEVVQGFANVLVAEHMAHDMRTMSSLPDLEMYKIAEESRKTKTEALKDIDGLILTMVIQPIPSSAIKVSNARGGNPMGLKAQNQQWFLCMADYRNPKDEAVVRKACKELVDEVEAAAKKNGTFLPFRYSNYCSRDQNPLASYGEENLKKLKDIALKYDPEEVFQTLQYDGWLVCKA